MDCVEEVEVLPPAKKRGRGRANGGRSKFFREIMEQFVKSDAKYWHVIKDYDDSAITADKIGKIYSQFYQILRGEYADKKVSIVMRNSEIYIVKEGAENSHE